jgi:hypothetical protein
MRGRRGDVKVHLAAVPFNPYDPVPVCGTDALAELEITPEWRRVTCGRCLRTREYAAEREAGERP